VKNTVFWDVAPCGSSNNRRFQGTYSLRHQSGKNQRARNNVELLVTANVVPSSLILSTLMTEAIPSSRTSVLTRAARRFDISAVCSLHGVHAASTLHAASCPLGTWNFFPGSKRPEREDDHSSASMPRLRMTELLVYVFVA
jgi:hypothetical protein